MTEPPRPPGSGDPNDPTQPFNPYGSTPPPPPPYGSPPPADPYHGYGGPQKGYGPSSDDKTWTLVAHFGGAAGALVSTGVGGWIVPLVAMLAKGSQSPAVRAESVKALNFQLLWAIVAFLGWATSCLGIGVVIFVIAMIIQIVFGVIAGIKASNNEPYNYPLTYAFIK